MSQTASGRGDPSQQEAAEPEIPLSQQQEALQRTVVATAIVFDRVTGTPWLGFSDTSNSKSPQAHYVQLGMSEDGWTVVDIDMAKKTARLSKDDVEIDVVVGARPEKPAPAAGARRPGGSVPASGRSPLLSAGAKPAGQSARNEPTSLQSLRQQRLARENAQREQIAEERKARLAADEEARRQKEEDDKRRAQERADREAELAAERAEREENNQRLKNLQAALEEQMAARRKQMAEEDEEDE